MFGSRVGRAWRGLVAALSATFFAVVSHALADRTAPAFLAVLLAFTVALPVCVAMAGRRLSWGRLSIAVGLSQFAFHALLMSGVGATVSSAPLPSAHAHSQDVLTALPGSGLSHLTGHADAWMWVAHACAAVLTILWIGQGERALRALVDLFGWRFLARALLWRPAPVVGRPAVPVGRSLSSLPAPVVSVLRRRGPPVPA